MGEWVSRIIVGTTGAAPWSGWQWPRFVCATVVSFLGTHFRISDSIDPKDPKIDTYDLIARLFRVETETFLNFSNRIATRTYEKSQIFETLALTRSRSPDEKQASPYLTRPIFIFYELTNRITQFFAVSYHNKSIHFRSFSPETIVMDSAVIGKTGDESAFQKGAEILNSGPIDVADRLQRDTLLRPRPGDSPVYPNRRGEIAIGSHISVPKNDSSDLALLRRRMRGKQPMRHSKILQQRSNEAIRHRNEKWNGERYPCANNNSNIDSDKDSTGKTVKEVEAERKSKTNVAKDSSMPPPNKEMTDLLLLQRQNRIIGLQNPMFRAQIAMQEERDHEVQVEIPAQMRRWTISKTNASKDGTTTVAISDTDEEESMTMTCDTVMYSRTLPYNPDGYHFTNLPDGTPMYSSLPPFRSLSTGDQEGKKKDIATSNKSEEKNEEKDDASLTKANYFAPLQISFHTMGGKQDGILFISKSSIGPLAQSSCLVDQRELIERNAVTNDTIEERSSDIIVDDDWNQSDNGFTKKDRGEVVCDGGFASSSTTSALNSSMFSVISPDTISEKVNGNGNEDIASHRDNRGDIVIDQNPIQRKLRYDNEAAVEGVVSEEDTQQPQNAKTTKTQFKDIIGHQSVKLRLDEVLLPLALPANLSRTILKGVRSLPASILLYGPPGCGKVRPTSSCCSTTSHLL
jgi:hypothetical protein